MSAPSLERLVHARSVAVVGVSSDPQKYGSRLARSIVEAGFAGELKLVSPKGGTFMGRELLPSLTAAGAVDVVVVAVPARACPGVVAEAAALGCGCAVVVATGFAEVGEAELERELVAAADGRLRVVGPNCMGFLSAPAGLNALGDATIPHGGLAVVAQSGIVGMAIYQRLKRHRLGLRAFFSVGNQADVGIAELARLLAEDDATDAVLIYAEQLHDQTETLAALRALAERRPVALLHGGRTAAGAQAALAHTASRPGDLAALDVALRACGVVVVHSEAELVLAALAFSLPFAPRSAGVSLVSDSGGFATLGADLATACGLRVEPHPEPVQAALRELLVPQASVRNPVDMIGGPELRADLFESAVDACLAHPDVDAAVLLGGYGGYEDFGGDELLRREVAAAPELVRVRDERGKPLVVQTLYADVEHAGIDHLRRNGVPVVADVEDAMRILASARAAEEARR